MESNDTTTSSESARAWRTPYLGDSHLLLERVIHDMKPRGGYMSYTNFLRVVQSTGTGKSRTVDEVARLVFTVPFNLRIGDEDAYPRPDLAIRKFMRVRSGDGWRESRFQLRCRYIAFLVHLFDVVRERVAGFAVQKSAQALAAVWHKCLADDAYRREVYDAVISRDYSQWTTLHDDREAGTAARRSAQDLLDTIAVKAGGVTDTNRVQLLITFDDCDFLKRDCVAPTEGVTASAFQLLAFAFNYLLEYPIFVVYVSAEADLSPALERSHSYYSGSRARNAEFPQQAPFVEMPFDVWDGPIIVENTLTLEAVCKDELMVRFGRPLFWTRYMTGSPATQRAIVDFALEKLIDLPSPFFPVTRFNDETALAALGLRLLLDFAPGPYAAETDNLLVAHHMRIAFSIPHHREFMHSGAPSEPILAEAAARVMARVNVLELLATFLDSPLLQEEAPGALLTRVLLTLAHDRAVQALIPTDLGRGLNGRRGVAVQEPPHEIRYSKPIPVITLLRELLGEQHMAAILRAQPDNIEAGATFAEAFRDARVHFTHFARAGDDSVMSDKIAWAYMARGMAFHCAAPRTAVDFVLPMMLHRGDKLGRRAMSCLLIRIKRGSKIQPRDIDAERLGFFTPGDGDQRPYITLDLEFRAEARPPLHGVVQDEAREERRSSSHPRYAILVAGCSADVYGIKARGEEDVYTRLLGGDVSSGQRGSGLKMMWTYGAATWGGEVGPGKMEYTTPELSEGVSVRQFTRDDAI